MTPSPLQIAKHLPVSLLTSTGTVLVLTGCLVSIVWSHVYSWAIIPGIPLVGWILYYSWAIIPGIPLVGWILGFAMLARGCWLTDSKKLPAAIAYAALGMAATTILAFEIVPYDTMKFYGAIHLAAGLVLGAVVALRVSGKKIVGWLVLVLCHG